MAKERGIIFSGEMVRAILENRKTMTRRLRGLELINKDHYGKLLCDWALSKFISFENGILKFELQTDVDDCKVFEFKCPYGQPGDRLWVRETFRESWSSSHTPTNGPAKHETGVEYKATWNGNRDPHGKTIETKEPRYGGNIKMGGGLAWTASIFMPRWASRITLEITDVKVERLQNIRQNTEELRSEGIELPKHELYPSINTGSKLTDIFERLWDSLNKKYPFESNPFVWVISFKRIN